MPLIILKWKNWLEKVRRICAEFTKMVSIVCKLRTQNLHFFSRNSDNPSLNFKFFRIIATEHAAYLYSA